MSLCPLAFRCTGRIPASSTSAARPAAAGCSRSAGCSIRSGRRTSIPSTTSCPLCRACAHVGRRSSRRSSKSTRAYRARATRRWISTSCRRQAAPDESAAIAERLSSLRPEAENAVGRRLSGGVREGRRHRRRADHRGRSGEPERTDAGTARRHRRVAVHARPASRWRERPEVSRLCVPGGSGLCGEHRRARDGGGPSPGSSAVY